MFGSTLDSSKLSVSQSVAGKARRLGIRVGVTGLVLSFFAGVSQVCLAFTTPADVAADVRAVAVAMSKFNTSVANKNTASTKHNQANTAELTANAQFKAARAKLIAAQKTKNAAQIAAAGKAFQAAQTKAKKAQATEATADTNLDKAILAYQNAAHAFTNARRKLAADAAMVSPKS